MDYPKVSVAILNFNGKAHLETCIDSISRTNYANFEILLVDNGSSDGSVEYVKGFYPEVKLIQNSQNLGTAAGYNCGIVNSEGKYVAIMNNDIEVDPDWLIECIKVAEEDNRIAVCDSKYMNFYHRKRFDTVSAGGRLIDMFGNVFTRGRGEEDKGKFDTVTEVFVGLTLFRRNALVEAGIFDEVFFYGSEEIDLCWRLKLKGYKVFYVPKSKIYHKISQSVTEKRRFAPGFYFHTKKNRLQMLVKNHSLASLFLAMPVVFFEYMGYLAFWAATKDPEYFMETLRAMLWVLLNFRSVWVKHENIQGSRKVSQDEIRKTMVSYCGDMVQFSSTLKKK